MVREIKRKNLWALIRRSAREIGHKTIVAYALLFCLIGSIIITFILAQSQQDLRQRAATLTNCSVSGFIIDSVENRILGLVNKYRNENGLSSLTLSSHLNRAAEWKSLDMARISSTNLSHTDSLGRTFDKRIYDCGFPIVANLFVGENLGVNNYNERQTAEKVFASWQKSPTHNTNLLESKFRKVGVSRVEGQNRLSFWSLEFGEYNDGTDGSYIGTPEPTASLISPNPTSQTTCVNSTPGSVTFNWTQQQSNMSYEIYYTYTGGSQTVSAGSNISSYTIHGFSPGLTVTWQVRAYTGNSIGPYTTPRTFTVPSSCTSTPTATPTIRPATPTPTKTTVYTLTPSPTISTSSSPSCKFTSSNVVTVNAGVKKTLYVTASNLLSGSTYLGWTSGTDKLFYSYGNKITFNSTMSMTTPSSVYSSYLSGGNKTFTLYINTTSSTPQGQYTLDAIYLYKNGSKTQCIYNGLGGMVIHVQGSTTNPTSTPTRTPTPASSCSTTCYRDLDGDGYGKSTSGTLSNQCSCPSGYRTNATDCYDNNANARPGQTGYFGIHRGDGSFDYDCNGVATKKYPVNSFSTSQTATCFSTPPSGTVNFSTDTSCGVSNTFRICLRWSTTACGSASTANAVSDSTGQTCPGYLSGNGWALVDTGSVQQNCR